MNRTLKRSAAASIGVVLAVVVWSWFGRELGERSTRPGSDPDTLRAVATRLAEYVGGLYDSHPDAEVGRVLVANRDELGAPGVTVATNAFGLRERDFVVPKPTGTVRIVLLGDSFVFGWGVEAEERVGAVLERELRERLPADAPEVECLHVAIASWNLTTECTFLRRQLDRLEPDLVFHFTVSNDLEDVTGVRGFGAQALFPVTHRERADGLIWQSHPERGMGFATANVLPYGLDGESRGRFDESRAHIERLVSDLSRLPRPAPYVLVVNWDYLQPSFHEHLGSSLDPARRFYLPSDFWGDAANRLSDDDSHWSPHGHERMARILHGLILERDLLPWLPLAPWPEARAEAARLDAEGLAEARAELPAPILRALSRLDRELDIRTLDRRHAAQVYGGIDAQGHVAPYAALVLRPQGARTLELTGRALPDRTLEGAEVRVRLDGLEVARFELVPDAPIAVTASVPPALAERELLALQLVTSDWVYRGDDLRQCVGWRLERAALVD